MLHTVLLCGSCIFGMCSLRCAAGRGGTADRSGGGCGWKVNMVGKYSVDMNWAFLDFSIQRVTNGTEP